MSFYCFNFVYFIYLRINSILPEISINYQSIPVIKQLQPKHGYLDACFSYLSDKFQLKETYKSFT